MNGWEGGIDKEEFIAAFENQGIEKWNLVCLFYYFDVEDVMDDIVHLETMVKLISKVKGINYQPVSAKKLAASPSKNASKAKSAAKSSIGLIEETK